MSTRRTGKPYIWVTWLAKLLGGDKCVWSAWFKAHFKYDKYEEMASDLAKWNRDHNKLMAAREQELKEDGWTVTTESDNDFKLEGKAAVVAGKPDIIATKPGHILAVDGKTGRERDSDIWQVLIYLFGIPKSRPDLQGDLLGEVQYARDDQRITLTPADLTDQRMSQLVTLINQVASDTPPAKVPTRDECKRCNIGPKDCPERIQERRPVAVGEF
jgi:hypothetical protein